MSGHIPPTDDELTQMQALCDAVAPGPWVRYGAMSSIGSSDFARYTAWIVAARPGWPRCIKEIERLRTALAREVRQWTHLEQEIGGHVAEIRQLRAEVERLTVELNDAQWARAEDAGDDRSF